MFIAALFSTAKMWKQPKYLSDEWTDEQVKKTWHVHTVEFCSALKRREFYNMQKTSYMNYLKQSNSWNQGAESQLPRAVGKGGAVTNQKA